MTSHDDAPSTPARHRPTGRQIAIGAAGLAVVLGAGGYLIASGTGGSTETRDAGALAPIPAPSSPAFSAPAPPTDPSPSGSASASPSVTVTTAAPAASPTVTSKAAHADAKKVRQEIDEARAKAAKAGVPLQRPLTAQENSTAVVSTVTEEASGEVIRVSTARGDLTGQSPRILAADKGRAVGNGIYCTQKIRFSENAAARAMANTMLCWRTSSTRSVVTLAVARKGKPATATSIHVIDREWAKLG
nr:hypothetical protein [uncultured Actinoplanes sp.]